MKRRNPKITATVHYIDQEAPPELREQALRIYAQWLIDAYLEKQITKSPDQVPIPVEHMMSDSEDW